MIFLDDGTYEEYYKNNNQNIIDGNEMNISLIIMEENMVQLILLILHVMDIIP